MNSSKLEFFLNDNVSYITPSFPRKVILGSYYERKVFTEGSYFYSYGLFMLFMNYIDFSGEGYLFTLHYIYFIWLFSYERTK